jgi:hypothetical protein
MTSPVDSLRCSVITIRFWLNLGVVRRVRVNIL